MGGKSNLFGCRIDALTMDETIDRVEQMISEGIPRQHAVVNVAKIVSMKRDPELQMVINGCDMVNADGMPIVWASRLLRDRLPDRVAGVDLFQELVKLSAERGYRPFFFGAREHVVQRVVETFKNKYPALRVAGFRNGYFAQEEELEIARRIRDTGADMLFVGFSSPRKEKFIQKWMSAMQVPFSMGVGGSFDIVAGVTKRAPQWMQQRGLEWFYRIIQEPGRMWKRYATTNPVFVGMVLKQMVLQRTRKVRA